MFQRQPHGNNASIFNLIAVILGIFLIFLLVACPGSNSLGANFDVSEILILDSQQGQIFTVQTGDVITIRLAENPTTGYRWEISKVDDQLVEFQSSDYVKTSGATVGGGGERTFNFRAKSKGNGQILLRLRRAWEAENQAIKEFTANIQVH
jgi:inhibitor of cysteine peptidase